MKEKMSQFEIKNFQYLDCIHTVLYSGLHTTM